MQIKIFSDLIDAIGKVAKGVKAIADLPKMERDKYRQTMDETYRLIDTTLNMVIIRLGDILLLNSDNEILPEVERLGNFDEWHRAEREFRLCKSLRATVRETETLRTRLTGKISAKDWNSLLDLMNSVLATESEVAGVLADEFSALADAASKAAPDTPDADAVRKDVEELRTTLIEQRQKLIQQEIKLYAMV